MNASTHPQTPAPAPPTVLAPPPTSNRRARKPRRWLPWLLGALLVALIAAGFVPRPTPVETAGASTGVLRATVNEEGRTRIRQRYLVSSPVAGNLRRLDFKAGAAVVAHETVLAVIDPISSTLLDSRSRSLAEARRDTAAAQLEKAREALRFATLDLGRFERLHREGTVSSQELESYQWRHTAAGKEIAAAESALRLAQAELAEPGTPDSSLNSGDPRPPVIVRAPVGGRVLKVFEENARVIAPGTPLLEVGDPADLEVVIEVLSRDGASIAQGAKVLLEQWGGPEALEARVRLVEPAAFTKVSALGVEEQRVNVVADLVSPPAKRPTLGDGFRVEARIVVWEAADALKVPAGALFRQGLDWSAYVIDGGRAALRPIKVGRSSGTEMQVLEGLRDGEPVILYPGDRIKPGLRVKPIVMSVSP